MPKKRVTDAGDTVPAGAVDNLAKVLRESGSRTLDAAELSAALIVATGLIIDLTARVDRLDRTLRSLVKAGRFR